MSQLGSRRNEHTTETCTLLHVSSKQCFCSMTLRDEVSFDPEHDGCDDTCAGSTDGEICGGLKTYTPLSAQVFVGSVTFSQCKRGAVLDEPASRFEYSTSCDIETVNLPRRFYHAVDIKIGNTVDHWYHSALHLLLDYCYLIARTTHNKSPLPAPLKRVLLLVGRRYRVTHNILHALGCPHGAYTTCFAPQFVLAHRQVALTPSRSTRSTTLYPTPTRRLGAPRTLTLALTVVG